MLETLKQEVCVIAKRAQRDGLCKHRSGNFSAKDPDTGLICITPTGLDREEMSARDIIVMDLDANVIENETGLRPTSEVLMHLALYNARPELHAIVHTHSMYATSMAILNKPLPAIVYEIDNLGHLEHTRVPVAPYGRPGTPELANNVTAAAREADSILMENHGAVAVDTDSLYEAFLRACYIEELAHIYYNTLTANGGTEPQPLPQDELESWEYPSEIKFPSAR